MSNITNKVSHGSFEEGLSAVNGQMSSAQIDDMIKVPWLQEEGVKEIFKTCTLHSEVRLYIKNIWYYIYTLPRAHERFGDHDI